MFSSFGWNSEFLFLKGQLEEKNAASKLWCTNVSSILSDNEIPIYISSANNERDFVEGTFLLPFPCCLQRKHPSCFVIFLTAYDNMSSVEAVWEASNVFLPIMMWCPDVILLNRLKSFGRCQTSSLFFQARLCAIIVIIFVIFFCFQSVFNYMFSNSAIFFAVALLNGLFDPFPSFFMKRSVIYTLIKCK
jgi:hypothetical protein